MFSWGETRTQRALGMTMNCFTDMMQPATADEESTREQINSYMVACMLLSHRQYHTMVCSMFSAHISSTLYEISTIMCTDSSLKSCTDTNIYNTRAFIPPRRLPAAWWWSLRRESMVLSIWIAARSHTWGKENDIRMFTPCLLVLHHSSVSGMNGRSIRW